MAKSEKIKLCKNCNSPLPEGTMICPVCGAKNKKPVYKKWWFWVLLVLIVLCLGSCGSDTKSDTESKPSAPSVSSSETKKDAKDSGETKKISESKPAEKSIPREYRSALRKAKIYSQSMHMSKAAIYEQLVSEAGEGFTKDAAQYAVDNLVADWNANALQKAKIYSETMDMSRAAIYEQLVSPHGEQFTPQQAQYAVDHLR